MRPHTHRRPRAPVAPERTAGGDGWRLRHEGQALEVSEHGLTKLCFGPERFPEFAPGLFPLAFFQWPLGRV